MSAIKRKPIHHNHLIPKKLFILVARLRLIQQEAKKLGLYTNDRELIECKCGLMEDVDVYGRLLTVRTGGFTCRDTGLRFKEINPTSFRCPQCRSIMAEGPDGRFVPRKVRRR